MSSDVGSWKVIPLLSQLPGEPTSKVRWTAGFGVSVSGCCWLINAVGRPLDVWSLEFGGGRIAHHNIRNK